MVAALIFDVFGTLVDWRTSVADALVPHIPHPAEREEFVEAWRAAYDPAMDAVRTGRRPFVPLDVLHRENLDVVLAARGLDLAEAERMALNLAWHRLDAWADVGAGLARLGRRHILAAHSNGNVRLMLDLARHNGWRWDAILGAEVTGRYKPDPESYRRACAMLMLPPAEVMMVAAHNDDLRAARAEGLATAFVPRPTEHGAGQTSDLAPAAAWDVVAADLAALAEALDDGDEGRDGPWRS